MKIAYVATDNSIFYTEADCKKHEESLCTHPERYLRGITASPYNNDWDDEKNPSSCIACYSDYPPSPDDFSFSWFKADSAEALSSLLQTFCIDVSSAYWQKKQKGLVGKWMCFAMDRYGEQRDIYFEGTLEDTISRVRLLAKHLGTEIAELN